MQRMICRAGVCAAALAVLMLGAPCGTVAGQEFAGREKLRAQSDEFRKDVIRMTDGVHVAVGYSASNVTLIQGDGGAIIVDTASDPVEARAVRAAFGNLLDAPVRATASTRQHIGSMVDQDNWWECCEHCSLTAPLAGTRWLGGNWL